MSMVSVSKTIKAAFISLNKNEPSNQVIQTQLNS